MERIGFKKQTVGPYNQHISSTLSDSRTHIKPFFQNMMNPLLLSEIIMESNTNTACLNFVIARFDIL